MRCARRRVVPLVDPCCRCFQPLAETCSGGDLAPVRGKLQAQLVQAMAWVKGVPEQVRAPGRRELLPGSAVAAWALPGAAPAIVPDCSQDLSCALAPLQEVNT
jgi:hypothetical protein